MNEIKQINPKQIIKQSNRLVVARYRLTKYEQRMMIAICSQLNKNADEFETVRVRAKDLAEFCKFKGQDAYRKVHSTILKLMSRTLQIQKDDGKWYLTHWLQSAEYLEGGIIEYCIDQRLKPDLLQLKSAYLSTSAEPLMNFSRDYSARLYFILKKLVRLRTYIYDLDFFVDRFQLGKTYKQISNLKNRVLEPAIAEINEKSDILVRHDYIKEGRAYTKIQFIIFLKDEELKTDKKEIAPPPAKKSDGEKLLNALGYYSPRERRESHKEEPIPAHAVTEMKEKAESTTFIETDKKKWNDQQQADYDLMLKHGVWAQTAQKYIATYDHERIERNIQGVLKSNPKGNIRDIGAVMANAIAHDTYLGEAEESTKAQARALERARAEAIKAEKELIKDNERREKNAIKNEELAKIRENKSKKELAETLEKVLVEYKNNNEILNEEMRAELATNGIPETDFSLYQSATMRTLIKYI